MANDEHWRTEPIVPDDPMSTTPISYPPAPVSPPPPQVPPPPAFPTPPAPAAPQQPRQLDPQWGPSSYPEAQPQHPMPQQYAAPPPYVAPPQPLVISNQMAAGQGFVVKGPNHVLHLLLTIITFGLWLPVWLIIALRNKHTVSA